MANPNDSAIRLNAEQEEKVSTMDSESLKEYLRGLAVEQNLVRRDLFSPDVLIPVEHPQPKTFAKVIVVNGVKHVVEAGSKEGLDAAEIEVYRTLFGADSAQQTREAAPLEQLRNDNGQFVSRDDPSFQAELKLKMMTGEIDVPTYIRESGALDGYLSETYGLDPNAIANQKNERGWQEATQQFLKGAGREWQGGAENLQRIQQILHENGLENGIEGNKLAALEAAYKYMVENDLMIPNPEIEAQKQIASSNDPETLRAAAHRSVGLPERPESAYNLWFDRK